MARAGRRPRRNRAEIGLAQPPFQRLRNPFRPFEILSADQIEAIHAASLQVLAEIGMNFLLPEARAILAAAGADVEPAAARVRFDPAFVEERIRTAPSAFTLHARNPERSTRIGADWINFAVVGSAPNVSDLNGGRRMGNFADYCNLIRLGHSLNIAHLIGGYPVEPVDLPPATRHLDAVAAMARYADRNLYGYALGAVRMRDAIEITRIARGVPHAQLLAEPSMFTVVNANSPLQYDGPMLEGVIEMARHNQPIVITPFTLAGAMAPITVAGRAGAAERRGARRHRVRPVRQPRLPCCLRRLHLERRHAHRRARVRHARVRPGHFDRRSARAALPAVVPGLQRHRLERAGRSGGV